MSGNSADDVHWQVYVGAAMLDMLLVSAQSAMLNAYSEASVVSRKNASPGARK
ncbi:MAG TPA: hypothetical protein VGU90_12575 [Terriglobales bacterium]|nr:hypothetical protein [Terriglobales bacterium]